jgi:hypothetical protein
MKHRLGVLISAAALLATGVVVDASSTSASPRLPDPQLKIRTFAGVVGDVVPIPHKPDGSQKPYPKLSVVHLRNVKPTGSSPQRCKATTTATQLCGVVAVLARPPRRVGVGVPAASCYRDFTSGHPKEAGAARRYGPGRQK